MDPALGMLQLYRQFQGERNQERPEGFQDHADTLIGEFLVDLKAKVTAAANHLTESDPGLDGINHSSFPNSGRLGNGRGARTSAARQQRGR